MKPRPKILHGKTSKIKTGCGTLFVTVNFDENNQPYEVFARLGKSGSCFSSQIQSLCSVISIALRNGTKIEEIIDKLKGHRCSSPIITDGVEILSCSDALAKEIEYILSDLKEVINDKKNN